MKKLFKLTLVIVFVLILSGCVEDKAFKEAYRQAKQCEEVGLDFKLSETGNGFIRGVECVID